MERPKSLDVESHIASLRRYARALMRDDAGADDLVQEALLRAIERAATFRAGGSLRAWLTGILHNEFINSVRRQASEARRDRSLAELQGEAVSDGDQEHAVQLARLATRFHSLPEQQRAVMHLIAVEGLSYRETADAIGVPIGTVMSRLSRARAALRQEQAAPGGRQGLRIVGGEDA